MGKSADLIIKTKSAKPFEKGWRFFAFRKKFCRNQLVTKYGFGGVLICNNLILYEVRQGIIHGICKKIYER